MVLKSGNKRCRIPIEVSLWWDEEDSLAVQMLLLEGGAEEVVWYFSRDLLLQGVNCYTPTGHGDIKFRLSREGSLLVCLGNASGHADLRLPHGPVMDFLNETTAALKPGTECLDELLDEAIEEILSS